MTLEEELDILEKTYGKINLIELSEINELLPRKKKVLSSYYEILHFSLERGNKYIILSSRSYFSLFKIDSNFYRILFENRNSIKNIFNFIYLFNKDHFNIYNNIKLKLNLPLDYFDEIIISKEILTYLNFNLSIKILDEIKDLSPFIRIEDKTNIDKILNLSDTEFNFILESKGKKISKKLFYSKIDPSNIGKIGILFKIYSFRLL